MEGKSKIIAVSDVHLGMTIENSNYDEEEYEKYRESQFRDFLDTLDFSHISDFVLLGDILDFWRHDFLNVIVDESCHINKLKELIEKYRGNTTFHYIAGNHDYHLLWLKENGADYPFHIKKSVTIQSNKKKFYFIHGYELEVLSWSSYKPLPLYENFSEDMCLVGEEGSRFADNMWKNYLEHSSRIKPKSIIEEIVSEAEGILSDVHREKSLISSQMLDMKEILCKAEEILSPSNHEKTQISSPISYLINISKLINQLEQFIEEAKELNKNIEESKSDIDLLDPPEKRMNTRDINVKILKKNLTRLSELWEDICLKAKTFDFNPSITKKVCKFVIPKHISFSVTEIAGSDVRHYMFGIKKDQYLIYGHTHDAYVDNDKNVANTGCWGIQEAKEKDFLYVEIIDDDVKIMSFIDKKNGSKVWKPENS